MKLALLLAVVGSALSHDAVFWASAGVESPSSETLASLVRSASVETPLVVFLARRLSLGDFSRAVGAYGDDKPSIPTLKRSILLAESSGSLDLGAKPAEVLEELPTDSVLYYKEPKDGLELAASPVVVVEAETLEGLEAKAKELLPQLKGHFRALLSGKVSESQARPKRAAEDKAGASATPAPSAPSQDPGLAYGNIAAAPPLGTWIAPGCGDNVALAFVGNATVYDTKGKPLGPFTYDGNAKWACSNTTDPVTNAPVSLANLTLSFTNAGKDGAKTLGLVLGFSATADGYWSLSSAVGSYDTNKDVPMSYANLHTLYLNSILGNSFACGQTDLAWFTKAKVALFAFSLENFQVEPFAGMRPAHVSGLSTNTPKAFTDYVDDCVPFFSPGVWMGVVSLFILLLTLIFGLSMIASLKTMDRFDDPKGKQLNINAKE